MSINETGEGEGRAQNKRGSSPPSLGGVNNLINVPFTAIKILSEKRFIADSGWI